MMAAQPSRGRKSAVGAGSAVSVLPSGVTPGTFKDYGDELLAELQAVLIPEVRRRVRNGAVHLAPRELAARMLALVPAPVPPNKMAEQVGPDFYDSKGVAVVLAAPGKDPISKQAVEQRRKNHSVLALQTSEGRWIYPTWQFRDGSVIRGLSDLLGVFAGHPSWSVATWLTTPSSELGGRTAVEVLEAARNDLDAREHLMRVAGHTAARWAA